MSETSGKTHFFSNTGEKNQALHPPKYLEQITCLEFVLVFTGFAKQGIILHNFCNDLQIICLKKGQFAKKWFWLFIILIKTISGQMKKKDWTIPNYPEQWNFKVA